MAVVVPFLDFCGDPASPVQLSVRLFCNQPALDQPLDPRFTFEEPLWLGYRQAGSQVFGRRQLLTPSTGLAATGLLQWVVTTPSPQEWVYGYWVVMRPPSSDGPGFPGFYGQVVAAKYLEHPARMAQAGDRLGLFVELRGVNVVFPAV